MCGTPLAAAAACCGCCGDSGTGYCTEATDFVRGLRALGVSVSAAQHGDSPNPDYTSGMPEDTRRDVDAIVGSAFSPQSSVVVCHSAPGFWFTPATLAPCPPPGASYFIGRTMFEVRLTTFGARRRGGGVCVVSLGHCLQHLSCSRHTRHCCGKPAHRSTPTHMHACLVYRCNIMPSCSLLGRSSPCYRRQTVCRRTGSGT